MAGQAPFLQQALDHLAPTEQARAAHWCDDGVAAIDAEPDQVADSALRAINNVVSLPPIKANVRPGESILLKLMQAILVDTQAMTPHRPPVLVFLHGDGAATPLQEADAIQNELLKT